MKVYVEPILHRGHIDFVLGYIAKEVAEDAVIILPDVYNGLVVSSKNHQFHYYRTDYYEGHLSGLKNRVRFVLNLFKIKRILKTVDYCDLEYLSFDELVFCLFGINNSNLLVHNNIAKSLNNTIKLGCLRRLSRNNVLLALDRRQIDYLIQEFKCNTKLIRHPRREFNVNSLRIIESPYLLFINSKSTDSVLLIEILSSSSFIAYAQENNFNIVIKGKSFNIDLPIDVMFIEHHLADSEYDSLISHASCLILTYLKEFELRFSSVVYQCMNNNTNFTVNNVVEGMVSFNEFGKELPLYRNIQELIVQIDRCKND